MPLLARVKTWIANEEITAADLNAEFDNLINNLQPSTVEDASGTVAEMQQTFDPGSIGLENLPESLREELQALRAMIRKVTGKAQWYEPPGASLESLIPSINATLKGNRIISGFSDVNGQPQFLQANASDLDLALEANSVNLVYNVNGQEFSATVDQTVAVQNGFAAGNVAQYDGGYAGFLTTQIGEKLGSEIVLTSAGAEYNTLNRLFAFRTTNGPDTEYFIGRVADVGGVKRIVNCYRGFLFDSTQTAQRVELAAAQSIELLRLSWIFVNTDGTVTFNQSGNEPVISAAQPGSPAVNDYWFDLAVNQWKIYDGANFIVANAVLAGLSAQENGACVATRSFDFDTGFSALNDISLELLDAEKVSSYRPGGLISVYGRLIDLANSRQVWDMASDLDTGVSEASGTEYYFYMASDGTKKISDERPHDRMQDLKGHYHPWKPWRCIGYAFNDGSQDLINSFTLGTAEGLSDGSISTRKLRQHHFGSNGIQSENYNFVAGHDVSIVGTGNSNSARIKCSGRAVLLVLSGGLSGFGDGVQFRNVFIEFQRRIPGGTFVGVGNGSIYNSGGAVNHTIPPSMIFLDNPGPGDFEYRVAFTDNDVNGQISAIFKVMEL